MSDAQKPADLYKRQAAEAALALVEDGMVLGLGTGSTAAHFVTLLSARVRDGLSVSGVPTSEETRALALAGGVEVIEPDETTMIDLAVDGADECDGALNLIKGGGGALLRETIVANAAARFVVIADESKLVGALGRFPLPVEIDQACWSLTVRAIRQALGALRYDAPRLSLRGTGGGGFKAGPAFVTDGGNFIVDCALERIGDPQAVDRALRAIPGVVETGLFLGMADLAFVGGPGGVRRIG